MSAARPAPAVRVVNQTFSSCSLEKGTAHSAMSGMDMSEGDGEYELPQDVADRLVKRTELRVSQVISQSKFVQENCSLYDLPRFAREEMDIGPMIAYGGFSNVHEIEGFKVETPLVQGVNQDKRYIIKHLNPKLAFNPKKLVVGAKDLVMEAHFLSSLDHENIIRLRGWSASGIAGFSATGRADGFFLVFDRLDSTLSKRISVWREESKRRVKTSLIKNNRSSARMQLFNERMKTAIDISGAISYLHKKRVLYRDLKPANVGFDAEDTLKVFDFGLAVELPESNDPNQTYNLAGNTGTR
jgi:serine/threonine protein kinase